MFKFFILCALAFVAYNMGVSNLARHVIIIIAQLLHYIKLPRAIKALWYYVKIKY